MNHDDLPRGIYPMLYAFFDAHGALDRHAARRQVQACVNNGAHGVAMLGLGTEVNKLSDSERRQLLDWVAEELDTRLPLAVTVNAPTIKAQVEFARFARSRGASWVILPATVFVMQSLATLHTYGKRICALRMGLGEVFDREPALRPDAFGLLCAQRYASLLGPLA